MKNLYNVDYYEHGIESNVSCYSNYRWIPELTIPMAARIIEYLKITEDETILDFGCAKGYLVKAFRLLHRKAYGYDISDYAISDAPKDIKEYISGVCAWRDIDKYDLIISKDVFEHIPYDDIQDLLRDLCIHCKRMFAIIPLGSDGRYVVPAYELDKTHLIRENMEWWKNTFISAGFSIIEAKYEVKYLKESWSNWVGGNGFFVLKSGK